MSSSKKPTLKAVRGTRDLLPDQTPLWNHVEATARAVFARYGFGEIRTPIFEDTSLFSRAVGEETDIVSKEMFTWDDRDRFDEGALKMKWLSAAKSQYFKLEKEVRIGEFVADFVGSVNEIEDDEDFLGIEIVEFKPEIRQIDLDRLSLAMSQFPQERTLQNVRGIFVVPEERNTTQVLSIVVPKNVTILSLEGNYFMSAQKLTLRPENTAGTVRAYIEHKLGETGALQKLYYIGPQFRRERPQRGRYRQFWQIGAEVIGPPSSGSESPLRDAEILEMLSAYLDALGVRGWTLQLNSVGSSEDRARYNAALRAALEPIKDKLTPDNQRRAETNPLRVLDSKDEQDQALIEALPKIADYLSEDSRAHFTAVLAALDACGVKYTLNPRLVRGLDYYTRTTFEFTVPSGDESGLGTQNALLGGGRYDGLSEMLGGPRAPGIGFAIGEDRLILTLQAQAETTAAKKLDAYIAPLSPAQNPAALALARELRAAGLSVEVGDGTFKLRKSFDIADSLAHHIILLGEDETASNILTVKTFATGEQVKVARADLAAKLKG